jgi:hypothetical protein
MIMRHESDGPAKLAAWYRCRLTFCEPDESQILSTRHGDTKSTNCAEGVYGLRWGETEGINRCLSHFSF